MADTIDWDALSAKLPTERTEDAKAQRLELFRACDPNGNGYLSLAEVDKGLTEAGLMASSDHSTVLNQKVLMRAFQAAKIVSDDKSSAGGGRGADYIETNEFRLLLVYLQKYLAVWQMFDAVDESDDHRITLAEFQSAVAKMPELGVSDPAAAFSEMDQNGGGMILFDEFAEWVLHKQLALQDNSAE